MFKFPVHMEKITNKCAIKMEVDIKGATDFLIYPVVQPVTVNLDPGQLFMRIF